MDEEVLLLVGCVLIDTPHIPTLPWKYHHLTPATRHNFWIELSSLQFHNDPYVTHSEPCLLGNYHSGTSEKTISFNAQLISDLLIWLKKGTGLIWPSPFDIR